MKINYENNRIKKILEIDLLLQKNFPNEYKTIKNRLTMLNAVSNLSQISHLPPSRRHKLKGNLGECWAVDVSNKKRLIFKSLIEGLNPLKITEIIIIGIEDYH
ncbi:MAG: plasmid maintenance system killer protein [Acholeplasmatales bacterium]